jgi:hypothetical protein
MKLLGKQQQPHAGTVDAGQPTIGYTETYGGEAWEAVCDRPLG